MPGPVPDDPVQRPELDVRSPILAAREARAHLRHARVAQERATGSLKAPSLTTALFGRGGFGKTTVADWACHELRDEFPDGVLRVEFGESPSEQQRVEWYRGLVVAIDGDCPVFTTAADAGLYLSSILEDRRVLLVLTTSGDASISNPSSNVAHRRSS